MEIPVFTCNCKRPKKYNMVFDGGSTGQYQLVLCPRCYSNEDKQFLISEEVDRRMGWKPGRAERLARQRRLPHVLLPDGSIRFDWTEIEPLIVRVPAASADAPNGGQSQ